MKWQAFHGANLKCIIFNSFYGSAVEGQATVRYFMRMNYFDKDKTILSNQTAPLPYVSLADGEFGVGTTWENSVAQVLPNTTSLDAATAIGWNIAEIKHAITSGDRDISLLGLIQTAGKLTIADPTPTTPIEDNVGQGLLISHYLELDGVIDLVGESQLLQSEGSIVDADSGGYIERDQQGTANSFNYNYWTSSVGPEGDGNATLGTGVTAINADYTIDDVLNDGSNSDLYGSLNYGASPNAGGVIPPPGFIKTLSSYWLYKFNGPADNYDAWKKIDETSILSSGEGYTMKGTSGTAPLSIPQNYVFKGLPNNGDISLSLTKNITASNPSGDDDRLIGNPYLSAIDAEQFILDNMSVSDGGYNPTETVFNGALYFWDHFGEQNSHILKSTWVVMPHVI
tara:strand:- start:23081 stop:24274 length:1194 start_codon:yes stop_codon:yes gene_type:complete